METVLKATCLVNDVILAEVNQVLFRWLKQPAASYGHNIWGKNHQITMAGILVWQQNSNDWQMLSY